MIQQQEMEEDESEVDSSEEANMIVDAPEEDRKDVLDPAKDEAEEHDSDEEMRGAPEAGRAWDQKDLARLRENLERELGQVRLSRDR